jgi:hypothetical protein
MRRPEVDNTDWPPQTTSSRQLALAVCSENQSVCSCAHLCCSDTIVCLSVIRMFYFRMFYYYDLKLVHAFIFIIPCILISLFKVRASFPSLGILLYFSFADLD